MVHSMIGRIQTLRRKTPDHLQVVLRLEQFRILRSKIPTLYAVLLVDVGILAFSVYGSVSAALSLAIPGLFAILIIARSIVWLVRRGKSPAETDIVRYLFSTTLLAGAMSLCLGIWGVALINSDIPDKPFVPLFIAFGAIACSYSLSTLPRAAFATVVLGAGPVIVALLGSSVRIEMAVGLNLLLIFLLNLRLVVNQYDYLVASVVAHAEVSALAYADPLTGLSNRRAFIEGLETITKSLPNGDACAAVAMIDLDGFKSINDTFGHAAGDAVLMQTAQRIQASFATCHIVARLGGDEFAVLIAGVDASALVAEISRVFVKQMSAPFAVSWSQLRLTASIGIATVMPEDTSALAIMARADVALYEVKHAGGQGVRMFAPAMAMGLRRRMVIEQALRETDPPPRIDVVYQPICDGRTRQITGFEALARWTHPELGAVPPLEFIAVAEQTGTIAALSEQIFDTAIHEASCWESPLELSVNLSGIDLCRPGMPHLIVATCARHGFDPRRLQVEVTETSVLSDFDVARDQIELLRKEGIRVSLDDFGSGYASIAYLKEITFDRVKIDGELIADIITSPKAQRLVQGILQLCSAMRLPVTAEKIENEAELAILVGLGCDRLQGYLLSRPVDANVARQLASVRQEAA